MRRLVLLPVLAAAALVMTACTTATNSGPRTVTVQRTVTSGQTPSGGSNSGAPSSVVVVNPTTSASRHPSASATASASTSASPSAAPIVKVDPLKVDCSILVSPADVKKALGIDIVTGSYRIKDVADPTRGVTGKLRCRYGSTDSGKTGKVGVLLTQFKDSKSADKQVAFSRQTEQDNGSTVTPVTVKGYPAVLMINKGGEIVFRYDTWTLSVSTRDGVAPVAKLNTGLPILAEQVLTRILKNG